MLPSTRSISQRKMLQFAARRPIVPARGLSSSASMHFFRETAEPVADQASIVDRIEKLMTEMKGLPKQGMTAVQQQEFEDLQSVVQGTDPQEVKAKGESTVGMGHLGDARLDSAPTVQAAPTEPAEQAMSLPNQADSKPIQPAAAPAKPFDWQAHLAMQGRTVNPTVAHQVHWPTSTAKAAQAVPPFVNMLGPKQRKSLETARRDIALKEWFHRAAKSSMWTRFGGECQLVEFPGWVDPATRTRKWSLAIRPDSGYEKCYMAFEPGRVMDKVCAQIDGWHRLNNANRPTSTRSSLCAKKPKRTTRPSGRNGTKSKPAAGLRKALHTATTTLDTPTTMAQGEQTIDYAREADLRVFFPIGHSFALVEPVEDPWVTKKEA
jgi:hypothetical protein